MDKKRLSKADFDVLSDEDLVAAINLSWSDLGHFEEDYPSVGLPAPIEMRDRLHDLISEAGRRGLFVSGGPFDNRRSSIKKPFVDFWLWFVSLPTEARFMLALLVVVVGLFFVSVLLVLVFG